MSARRTSTTRDRKKEGGRSILSPPVKDVDLKLLGVFVAVVRCGGFSLAQNALNVSQATISIQISNLETRIGAKLCRRGRGGFALTQEGLEVFEAAKTLFTQIEDYRARIGGIRGKLVGEMNIGIIDNLIHHPQLRLSNAISMFKEVAGNVHINVHVAPPNDLERMVLDGQVHVATSYFPRRLPQLEYEPMFSMRMELYCGKSHPFFSMSDRRISESMVASMEHAQRGYVSLEQMHDMHKRFNYTARAHNIEGLAYLILSGKFLGFLSEVYARQWVEAGEMRAIRPSLFDYTSNYHAAFRKAAADTLAFKHLLRCLRAQVARR